MKNRLADLRAATYVADLPAGRPQPLDGPDRGSLADELTDGHRVVLAANHRKNPITESGDIDWQRVSRVKILRIENDLG